MVNKIYKIIEAENNEINFEFDDLNFSGLIDNFGNIWTKGKELGTILGISQATAVIGRRFPAECRLQFNELIKKYNFHVDYDTLDPRTKATIWINSETIIKVIELSKYEKKDKLIKWLVKIFEEIKDKYTDNNNDNEINNDIDNDIIEIDFIDQDNNDNATETEALITTINPKNGSYIYNNFVVTILQDKNLGVVFKGKDIATVLEYDDTDQAIRKQVDDEDRIKFSDLTIAANPVVQTGLEKYKKNTIFITESGLYSLILGSKKPEAKKFKRWVTAEVLPAIRKTGEYKLAKEYCFFDDHNIEDYKNDRVIYIADIGQHTINDEQVHLGKFGITEDCSKREDQHLNHFDKFIIKHVEKCNDHTSVETNLKKYLKRNDLLIKHKINGKTLRELFVITNDTTITNVINETKKLADNYFNKGIDDIIKEGLKLLKDGIMTNETFCALLNYKSNKPIDFIKDNKNSVEIKEKKKLKSNNIYNDLDITPLKTFDIKHDENYIFRITNLSKKTEMINEIYNAKVITQKEYNKLDFNGKGANKSRALANKFLMTKYLKINLTQEIISSWWNHLHILFNLLHVIDKQKSNDEVILEQVKYLNIMLKIFKFKNILDFKTISEKDEAFLERIKATNLSNNENYIKTYKLFCNKTECRQRDTNKNTGLDYSGFILMADRIFKSFGIRLKVKKSRIYIGDYKREWQFKYSLEPDKVGLKKILKEYSVKI